MIANPDYLAYVRCMQELDQIKDDEEAELLRNQMDFHWYRLNECEIEAVRFCSNRRNAMSTVTVDVNRSRFGFHPCDYQTFRKLKTLHKRYWQTVKAFAEWKRWDRKEPQNRVIRKWNRDEKRRKIGFEIVGPRPEPKYCPFFVNRFWTEDHGIIEAYQQARRPVKEDEVQPLNLSVEEIDRMYQEVESWFEQN
jgi:hypothetical protein